MIPRFSEWVFNGLHQSGFFGLCGIYRFLVNDFPADASIARRPALKPFSATANSPSLSCQSCLGLILLTGFMFPVEASATAYLNLRATSNTSTFTVTFGGGDTYSQLQESVSGTWNTVTAASGSGMGSVELTRANGTYTFRVQSCSVIPNPPAAPNTVCTTGATKSIVVDTVPNPVVSAGFNPTTINEGGSATFSWSATNATSCSATGISGVSGTSGSIT